MSKRAPRNVLHTLTLLLVACSGGAPREQPEPQAPGTPEPVAPAEPAAPKGGPGVDYATKTIKLGVLNDESGPAMTIGKPYAVGKRVLAAQINAGGSGLLPEGWKIELVERDHGYNPHKSVEAYQQISGDVLMLAHSFGTPNTLPLLPMLERDHMIALPASQSSQLAQHRSTIPAAPSYELEAMRGMDFVVAEVEKAHKKKSSIKAAIVYQQDDYGADGLAGWKKAAAHHGVTLVSEQTVKPGQHDMTAIVQSLQAAGATHVMLSVLPSATGPLLDAAAARGWRPVFLGQMPSWIDGFFNPEVIPSALFAKFYWLNGATYWGEDVPGMRPFLEAYEKYGKAQAGPDFYLLMSYVQGLMAVGLIQKALEAGDLTREALFAAVPKLTAFDGNGLAQPMDLSRFPYVTSTRTRVLKPDFAKRSWTVAGDYAEPAPLADAAAATTAAGAAPADAPTAEAAK